MSARGAVFVIQKKEAGPYWPRLVKASKKPHWLQTDFSKWKDEDEDAPAEEDPMGGMDFSQFGGGVRPGAPAGGGALPRPQCLGRSLT